ncbi:MAG: polysaccharide deacetylase family protein [Armatimonadetes bacterium]|nr:polysaccharide deacetylase family protein [Armatimonadota bacterium]
MSDISVLFGFDCETDVGSWTPFYEGLQHGTPRLLRLCEEKGITGTYYFTGEAAHEYPAIVREVAAAGHEVGTHSLQHETVGDAIFDIPGVRPILPEEVPLRLQRATEYVAEALGEQPVSWRCPRLWGSTAVCNALDAMGYVSDASYPMYHYVDRLVPYHPSRTDWTQEGDLDLVQIPNFADLSIDSTDPYGRDRDQWPLWRTESADALLRHIDAFVGYVDQRNLPAVLCFYFHPWEFWPMPSEFDFGEGKVTPNPFIVKNCGDYATEQLAVLIDRLQERGATFTTARDLAAAWS